MNMTLRRVYEHKITGDGIQEKIPVVRPTKGKCNEML